MAPPWTEDRRALPANRRERGWWWLGISVIWLALSAWQLGERSPFTYGVLPQFHPLGNYWQTPEGYTTLIEGHRTNRDSLQFVALAEALRHGPQERILPLNELIYVRFVGYSWLMLGLAPLLGMYGAGVALNMLAWMAALWCGMDLAWRWFRSRSATVLMGLFLATAPLAGVFVGQLLPYVPGFALWLIGLWLADRFRVCDVGASWRSMVGFGLFCAAGLFIYDVYHLVAIAWILGWRRVSWPKLIALSGLALAPRLLWLWWWSAKQGWPMNAINQQSPMASLHYWMAGWQAGLLPGMRRTVHRLFMAGMSVGDALAWIPLVLAWIGWRQPEAQPHRRWFVAMFLVGELPGLIQASVWPHLPRWHFFVFPAVLLLASLGGSACLRVWRQRHPRWRGVGWLAVAGVILLMNMHVLGWPQLVLRIVH